MSGNKINFTKEQYASIRHRGGSLLVSAAAGSGKTKVLVERLLGFIEEGASIDEFLVITYTRAAAFELREKIHEELFAKLSDSPGNKRLRSQALLCSGASIDTIHTICGEIIRENSHIVSLPPDFRISDSAESLMIMNETADSLLNEIYENINENPGFKQLIDTVAGARDDKYLIELIIDIYNKIRSLPYPGAWLTEQLNKQDFSGITDISETDSGAYILNKLKFTVAHLKSEMMRLVDEMESHPEFKSKYTDSVNEVIEQTDAFQTALLGGWDSAKSKSLFNFKRANSISGYDDLKEIRKSCISELKKCAAELKICSEEHIKEMISLSPAITALLQLLLRFDEKYSEEKRRRGTADFSDLEHLTLSLLVDEATGEKTELAHNLSERYKEIMIDEYQDINSVQEMIFTAMSKNSENIFMVGDVKQAIYRFRNADPTIFLSKYNSFKTEDGVMSQVPSPGTKIHLSSNFRSRTGILETVNHIFRNIMSPDFGEMDYSEKEWLVPGREDKKGKQGIPYIENEELPDVTIDLLNMSTLDNEDDEENPAAIQIEAEYIASEIIKLINSGYIIGDNNEKRSVTPSDIVILLRSMKSRAWQYASALSGKGILAEFPGGEGYFETLEISAILSLLSVIDNPMQDIPLVSLICGPIYKFTSDELAEVRALTTNTDYYEAIKKATEHEMCSPETSAKCKKVLDDINEYYIIAKDLPSDRFIWYVYNKTGLLGLAGAMQGGRKRRQNLIMLAESARQFEKCGFKGLFGFLTYIRSLQEKGESLPYLSDEKSSMSNASDAVRIMSVHKSKGLEFPVVFLANTTKMFNVTDINKNTVFHTDLGIGTMMVNKSKRIKYTTLTRNAIRRRLRDEMYSEELRVLYVAMTRAREKLIITSVLKDTEKTLAKINALPYGVIAPQVLMNMRSTAEWILAGVRNISTNFAVIRKIDAGDVLSANRQKESINKITSPNLIKEQEEKQEEEQEKVHKKVEFTELNYPYFNAINLPSKLTVTGIANLIDPDSDTADWLTDDDGERSPSAESGFNLEKREINAAERGTLIHHIMQHIDHNKCSTDDKVAKELQRLINAGKITNEQYAEINESQIIKFFKSDLGGRLINAKNVKKEFKFSILCPAKRYFPEGSDDNILVQGVIDCFFEEDGELVIIDYKSDKVTNETIQEKVKKYTPQLEAYEDALKRITGKKVKESIIYFFHSDTAHTIQTSSMEH